MGKLTEAQRDLRGNWGAFCDADVFDGVEDFSERMETAGLIEIVPVTDEALDEAFAYERGIERGGMMWKLTPAGRAALEASDA